MGLDLEIYHLLSWLGEAITLDPWKFAAWLRRRHEGIKKRGQKIDTIKNLQAACTTV